MRGHAPYAYTSASPRGFPLVVSACHSSRVMCKIIPGDFHHVLTHTQPSRGAGAGAGVSNQRKPPGARRGEAALALFLVTRSSTALSQSDSSESGAVEKALCLHPVAAETGRMLVFDLACARARACFPTRAVQ